MDLRFVVAIALLLTILQSTSGYASTHSFRKLKQYDRPQGDQDFAFASYYQTNMVLQREPHSSIIWGYGTVGATVNLSINIQEVYSAKVGRGFDNRGIWSVKIKPQPAGTRTDIHAVQDNHGKLQWILIENILFGEVFICSGQSNMQFTMSMVYNSSKELNDTVNYPNIRVFTVQENYSATPQYDIMNIQQPWSIPSPDTIGGKDWTYFSAVCWLYGKYLYDELKIPIGLVATTWGGTAIEVWSPPSVLELCHEPPSPADETPDYYSPADQKTGYHSLADETTGYGTESDYSQLYNAMIHPLLNMTIKGVIWYQGETNTIYRTDYYQCMFPNMIKSWRKEWYEGSHLTTDPDFPFGFVQIGGKSDPGPNYPVIRWHQTADYGYVPNPEMDNIFMAVVVDLPDPKSPYASVHTRDKQDVAARLVAGALSVIYHRTAVYEGPFPMKILETPDHKVFIQYTKYQQLAVTDESDFQICCQGQNCSITDPDLDEKWHTTKILEHTDHMITLDGNVCNDDFKQVDKVRYAWAKSPCAFKKCSVYNTLQYPGAPFILPIPYEM